MITNDENKVTPIKTLLFLTSAWALGSGASNLFGWAPIDWAYVVTPFLVVFSFVVFVNLMYDIAFRASLSAISQYMLLRDQLMMKAMQDQEEPRQPAPVFSIIDGGKEKEKDTE